MNNVLAERLNIIKNKLLIYPLLRKAFLYNICIGIMQKEEIAGERDTANLLLDIQWQIARTDHRNNPIEAATR